jgi:hypothetical protein
MDQHEFYYKQLVTEDDLNDLTSFADAAEKHLASDISEYGVFSGLLVSPTGPASTSVIVSSGIARDQNSGTRMALLLAQTVACDQDEFGDPTYADLAPLFGRWCSIYVRPKTVLSDPRVDGHGVPLWYTETESLEFIIHRVAAQGPIALRATAARPGVLTTAVLLADIWFEAGSTTIEAGDLEVNRREDYYRASVSGTDIIAGSPKAGLQQLGAIVATIPANLSNADLPTGANDGAHQIGLGGHATENTWQWEGARQLAAAGDNVHEAIQKIVSDLGRLETQGVPGSRLISAGGLTEAWEDGTTVDVGVYDDSVGGYLAGIVRDLAGVDGAGKVHSDAIVGAPYGLPGGDVQKHIGELLMDLNDHANTAGHPASANAYPATVTSFADGRLLPAATGQQRWEDWSSMLREKPLGFGTCGGRLVGVEAVSNTVAGETLSWPGAENLMDQQNRVNQAVLGRVNYLGDARLAGNFAPAADGGMNLGTLLRRVATLYTQAIRGANVDVETSGNLYMSSDVVATLQAEDDVVIGADITGSTGGEVRMYVGGLEQARMDQTALYPVGVQALGKAASRWSEGFLTTGIDVGTPGLLIINLNACGAASMNPALTQPLFAADGEYLYNGAATAYDIYVHLGFLKPGDRIDAWYADWSTAGAAANMQAILFRRPWGAGAPAGVSTLNPVILGRSQSSSGALNHVIEAGYTYYIEVWANNIANQRLYALSLAVRHYKWPV